jgi:pimeloyl-[acyl-carrier protein] methyl ester esterase
MTGLYVDVVGDGPIPLVVLHGWAMHGGVMSPLVDALKERCTVHVVDLPGHGYSRECTIPLDPHASAAAPPLSLQSRRRRCGWAGRWAG